MNRLSIWLLAVVVKLAFTLQTSCGGSPVNEKPPFKNDDTVYSKALGSAIYPIGIGTYTNQSFEALKAIVARTGSTQRAGPLPSAAQLDEEQKALEVWLAENPDSPYAPSLRLNLSRRYIDTGRVSRALEQLPIIWNELYQSQDPTATSLANWSLLEYVRLLTRLGRVEELTPIFEGMVGRPMGDVTVEYRRSREAWRTMQISPGVAFKCGVAAVNNLSRAYSGRFLPELFETPSPPRGFSVEDLLKLAEADAFPLKALIREADDVIPVPSVVHWKQNHYAAILSRINGRYWVMDPTFGSPRWMDGEAINEEASGVFLLPASEASPISWRVLTGSEAAQVFGQGYPVILDDSWASCSADDFFCELDPEIWCRDCACSPGMPTWSVSEPNLNITIRDTPLIIPSPRGPDIRLDIVSDQRREQDRNFLGRYGIGSVGFGPYGYSGWHALADARNLEPSGNVPPAYNGSVTVWTGKSGKTVYYFYDWTDTSELNPATGLRLKIIRDSNNELSGLFYERRDGARQVFAATDNQHLGIFYLSKNSDPQGNSLSYAYDQVQVSGDYKVRLRYITNAVGQVTTLNYDSDDLIYHVSAPGGVNAYFTYTNSAGGIRIESITDSVGIVSRFGYNTNGYPAYIQTPYGTTTFSTFDVGDQPSGSGGNAVDRWAVVDEPGGARQVFAYTDNVMLQYVNLPNTFPSNLIPTGTPLNTLDSTNRRHRSTFHWDRLQSTQVPNTDPTGFSVSDFYKARWRRWLMANGDGHLVPLAFLSTEQDPSPDGTTEGQITWYDYSGKPASDIAGTERIPSVVARVVPHNGGYVTTYTYSQRNSTGNITNKIDKWVHFGTSYYRTNRWEYDGATGLDLLNVYGPSNVLKKSYTYNVNYPHRPIQEIEQPFSETTTRSYGNASVGYRVSTVLTPAGLLSTYGYNGSGNITSIVDSVSGTAIRTNLFTWANGRLQSKTDERGLYVTYSYDNIGRLLSTTYPDATTEVNIYTLFGGESFPNSTGSTAILDRTAFKDRLGYTNRFKWTPLRGLAGSIDPRGVVTTNGFCACGALSSVTNALGFAEQEVTGYTYDLQGHRLTTTFPDGSTVEYRYDILGHLTNVVTGPENLYNYYDTLGRLYAVSNSFGLVSIKTFDVEDNVLTTTDQSGITVSEGRDQRGRLVSRSYPDGGIERWVFETNVPGVRWYTNQVGTVSGYKYDALGRRTNEIINGIMTNSFAYNAASDMTDLWDGNGNRTQWRWNNYGRVVAKVYSNSQTNLTFLYDANGRMTNRWSQAKLTTVYGYDSSGNLTNVNYNTSTDLKFQYDALNRVTNMIDSIGATKYGYGGGLLLWEDGPWSNDTVTYTYNSARRRKTMALAHNGGLVTNEYRYDLSGRLTNILSTSGIYRYFYPSSASGKILGVGFPGGLSITNSFDSKARMIDTQFRDSGLVVWNRHGYLYNLANQRIRQTRTNWNKGLWNGWITNSLDAAGELRTTTAYDAAGTMVPGDSFSYGYDQAWNIVKRTNNANVTTFSQNLLNQTTNVSGLGSLGFDSNGNRTNGPVSGISYEFDDENQLTAVQQYFSVNNIYRTEFLYDGRRRMRQKLERNFDIMGWHTVSTVRYIYDGQILIQERNANGNPSVSYTRGIDVSGELDEAGGIGGLLARSEHSGNSPYGVSSSAFYHSDANGNVVYISNSSGSQWGAYKFNPHGAVLDIGGVVLDSANLMRFSSKLWVESPGLYAYGYRFYDPGSQRWLNRDPRGERGGVNLYAFCRNKLFDLIDPFGDIVRAEEGSSDEFVGMLGKCKCVLSMTTRGRAILDEADSRPDDVIVSGREQMWDSFHSTAAGPMFIALWMGQENGMSRFNDVVLNFPDEVPPNDVFGCAVVLAHELGHALLGMEDEYNPNTGSVTGDHNVEYNENPVRAELGIPLRKTYHGFGPIPPK